LEGKEKMMEAKAKMNHTPGPWAWHKLKEKANERDCFNALERSPAGDNPVLTYQTLSKDPQTDTVIEVSEADAQLIAAAPDLLAALQQMDALVESLWPSIPWGKTFNLNVQALNEAPIAAKRAIAKALTGLA
jgi:hypothetical protein